MMLRQAQHDNLGRLVQANSSLYNDLFSVVNAILKHPRCKRERFIAITYLSLL